MSDDNSFADRLIDSDVPFSENIEDDRASLDFPPFSDFRGIREQFRSPPPSVPQVNWRSYQNDPLSQAAGINDIRTTPMFRRPQGAVPGGPVTGGMLASPPASIWDYGYGYY
jgi:hypothetical protein